MDLASSSVLEPCPQTGGCEQGHWAGVSLPDELLQVFECLQCCLLLCLWRGQRGVVGLQSLAALPLVGEEVPEGFLELHQGSETVVYLLEGGGGEKQGGVNN